jgi:hypothetical protein
MRIKFLSGPNAGKVEHAPRNQSTDLLIKAGLCEVIPDEPLAPAVVSWAVKFDSYGVPFILGSCSRACGTYRYLGKPDGASKSYFQHGCPTIPTPVPAPLVEQYRRAYGEAKPSSTGDDQKLINAKQYPAAIDRAADAAFAKTYGRARRW